jgi:hypothetical protein
MSTPTAVTGSAAPGLGWPTTGPTGPPATGLGWPAEPAAPASPDPIAEEPT